MKIGVVEGFFGAPWSDFARESYARFLCDNGGNFYIYAPKRDQNLRKEWRADWTEGYLGFLRDLSEHFSSHGIQFGVGLSPFGLGEKLSSDDQRILIEKLHTLRSVGVDLLGVFFDDMPVTENLAKVQVAVMRIISENFSGEIVFCPSFYSFDPILEKVFGKMPENYLHDVANGIQPEVSMAWTGPKVISPEISKEHLDEVTKLLKRSPFIWENFFANDGPKNCKFLKLQPYSGREVDSGSSAEAWGFNMMNQAELSKITWLSSYYVLRQDIPAEEAYEKSLSELCSVDFADFLRKNGKVFLEKGLDNLVDSEKSSLLSDLSGFTDQGAREVEAWLRGEYIVGPECLTD